MGDEASEQKRLTEGGKKGVHARESVPLHAPLNAAAATISSSRALAVREYAMSAARTVCRVPTMYIDTVRVSDSG